VPPRCTVPALARLVRPRDAALDGEIELEHRRPVAVPAVRPRDTRRQPVAGELEHAVRRQIEHDDVRLHLVQRANPAAGLDPAAVSDQVGGERVGDRPRTAARHRPAVVVRGEDERDSDRPGRRAGERPEHVRGHAAEQRTGRVVVPAAHHPGRRLERVQSEPGEQQRMARHVRDRSQEVGAQPVEALGLRREQPPPRTAVRAQPGRRLGHGADEHAGPSVVEWLRQVDLWPAPLQPVPLQPEPGKERRAEGERVDGGTDVVQHARDRQLLGAGAAADRVARLEHRDIDAGARERDSGREPVRP
jgi:hypothetical protein